MVAQAVENPTGREVANEAPQANEQVNESANHTSHITFHVSRLQFTIEREKALIFRSGEESRKKVCAEIRLNRV